MNADRRKRLTAIQSQLESLHADVLQIHEEEQEAKDNMPESMQAGEKGDLADAAIDGLQEVMDSIDDAVNKITEVRE